MKLCMTMLLMLALLAGCGQQVPQETLGNVMEQPQLPAPREMAVDLPGEAAVPTMEQGDRRYYLCEDYEITLERMAGGDLDRTVKTLTGYEKQDLTVLETESPGAKRYDFVWTTAGEQGQQLGRAAVLDDGSYHYTLTVLRPAENTELLQVSWPQVFSTFRLV